MVVELDVALAAPADDDVPQPGLDKKDGVVEAAAGTGKFDGVLIESEHNRRVIL